MFQSNKLSSLPEKESENSQKSLNFSQDKDYKMETIPVFSMKKDLENINNPEYANSFHHASETADTTRKNAEILSEKEKQSPFLSQKAYREIPSEKMQNKTNWQLLILLSIFIFLFLASGAIIYYYWITKSSTQNMSVPSETATPKENSIVFSFEKPNYLPLDIDNSNSDSIRQAIEKNAEQVLASGSLTPAEFVVTDLKNNPIGFEKFASKIGINFSPELFSSLETEKVFSLFIYNSNNRTRLGLAIDSKDDYKLKTSLFQEESNLPEKLRPLFPNISFSAEKKSFSSGSYSNTEIRYINLTSPEDLTVDYTIYKNKLIIGTTKMTIQSIMDYINNHSEVKGIEDIIDDTAIGEGNDSGL